MKVSGVQAVSNTADRMKLVIVVNADHPGERQRFTVAHELGHLYLSAKDNLDIEAACHRFAGAFLLPAAVLNREIGKARRSVTPLELFELKRLFGVSAQAIDYRAGWNRVIASGVAARCAEARHAALVRGRSADI